MFVVVFPDKVKIHKNGITTEVVGGWKEGRSFVVNLQCYLRCGVSGLGWR